MRRRLLVPVLLAVCPLPLAAQRSSPPAADTARAFADAGTAALMNRARAARLQTDRSIRSYSAVVRSRAAAALRMPLKDRTLWRQEAAARIRWSRDSTTLVQILASRAQHPGGVEAPRSGFGIDEPFDPSRDRMYFGMMSPDTSRSNDDFWIEHPLGEDAERHYRYESGDTMTVRLQDGRAVRVVELRVIPRRGDPHTVRGVLWVDTHTGSLVQAAFRLARTVNLLRDMDVFDDGDCTFTAGPQGERRRCSEAEKYIPGFFKPFEFDISLLTVEYSLWEMQHWLPRSMRFEGYIRAGSVRVPGSADVSYQMLDVVTDASARAVSESDAIAATLREWSGAERFDSATYRQIRRRNNRRQMRVIVPRDTAVLLRSELLPPPIWTDAPGFPPEEELRRLYDRVAAVAGPPRPNLPTRVGWGLGEPDMVRYNRVEALSVGARLTVPLPHVQFTAVGRIGVGDLHPNASLQLLRETPYRNLTLRAFHELTTVDEYQRALGFSNSLSSLVLGRDEGEYYRATGVAFGVTPPSSRRHVYDASIYLEDQRAVERNTHVALPRLWQDTVFRENIAADTALQYGALLHVRPWWGTDARRAQFGFDLLVQGEAGDYEHARGRLTLRTAVPIGEKVRVGAEVGAGTSTGSVPRQRLFYLGGASTLRGYEPSTVSGSSMARARLEIARAYPFANLAVFSDWGWAGDRTDIYRDDSRWAVGAGASLLDGVIRLDLARGLRAPRGWRLDLYLDALL